MTQMRKLKALMWKNFIVRYKRERLFLLELGVPLVLAPIYYLLLANIIHLSRETITSLPNNSSFLSSDNLQGHTVNYIPKSQATDTLMQVINASGATIRGFSGFREYLQHTERYPFLPLIVFRDMDNSAQMPRKLRFQMLDQNYSLHLDSLHQGMSSSEDLYENPAIAATQKLVTEAFINYWKLHSPRNAGETCQLEIGLHKMHHPGEEASTGALANLFSSIIIFSCVPIYVNIIKVIVSERHMNFQEFMILHHVSEAVYWLSWYLVGMLGFLLIEMVYFFVIVVAKVYDMYVNTNLLIISILVLVHATNNTSLCFLMATLMVNEASRSYVVILVVPFILYVFISTSVRWFTETLNIILGFSVSQVAFCMSVVSIVDMELLGTGYRFSNLLQEPSTSGSTSLFTGLLLMVLNTLFNLSCMWYFNRIQPRHYTEQHPFLLCFQRSDPGLLEGGDMPPLKQVKWLEPGSGHYPTAIQLLDVAKYSQNEVIVTEMTLNIYTDLITVILGPHGPDKSALIGMITGLMVPTHGTVIVHGYNIQLNKNKAQENIGLCPKNDVLYNMLTCLEHMTFFYKLKGIEADTNEILELLAGIQLGEKAYTRTSQLSAYEKRLLSLAVATIRDPKVIIMDGPSKGLSLAEQRELWSFLKTLKSNRAIIVTTSSVGEAEAVGDWAAVIINGDVRCYGSQAFLKYKYGVGYQLNVVKKQNCLVGKVTTAVLRVIPTASLQRETDKELQYFLPHDAHGKFSKLLFDLESQSDTLQFDSLGIYSTTMDEVFARVQLGYDPTAKVFTDDIYPVELMDPTMSATAEMDPAASATAELDPEVPVMKRESNFFKKVKPQKKKLSIKSEKNGNSGIDDKQDGGTSGANQNRNKSTMHWQSSSPADTTQSNSSFGSQLDPTATDSQDTIVNMELHTSLSLKDILDEYVFKKEYILNPHGISDCAKMMAICIKSFLVAKRTWLVTVLRTVTPSLLLIAGLLLDMHGHFTNQPLSYWYTLDNVPQSNVRIVTTNDTDDALVNIYIHLIPASHFPLLIQRHIYLNTTIQKTEQASANYTEERGNSTLYIGVDFTNKLYRHGVAEYSIKFYHTMSLSLQMLLNAHVRRLLGHDYSVNSGLVTVEYLQDQVEKILCPSTTLSLNLGLVIFSMATISTLIRDRHSGAKDLLELYGVTPFLYWLSTFAWDMAVYTVLVISIMVIFCLDKVDFIDDDRWIVMVGVLYLSAAAFFSEMYVLQKLFDVPMHGIMFFVILHIFTGVCGSFTLLFWKYTRSEPEYLRDFIPTLNIVLEALSPLYSYTAAVMPFPALATVLRSKGSLFEYINDIEFNGVVVGLHRPLMVLVCQSLLFWVIVLLIDSSCFRKLCNIGDVSPLTPELKEVEDEDLAMVRGEVNLAVLNNRIFEASLVLQDLRKCYGKHVAVDGTFLILYKGDCFGLLGPNGSGKSTTLRMITGIEPVTSGSAYVKGYSIEDYLSQVRNLISFTPQHNYLCPHLTGRETMLFFGRLRGIPDSHLHKEVDSLLNVMTLKLLADSRVDSYGKSKRRLLSVARGFLGSPVLVILDEPSKGLDIEEKKVLWSVMRKVTESESTILFTTDSVEECETVCTNMAIQVSGKLKCLGSPSHLTSRYAVGYTIVLYLRPEFRDAQFTDRLIEYVVEKFPDTTVSERNSELLRFRIRLSGEKLHEIFHTLKGVMKKFHLQNYMVHETTLEQVYLSFTLGYQVKPVKLIPIKKTVTWAEGTIDVVNSIPNKYSDYQNKKTMRKPSISPEDIAKYFKKHFPSA